MSATSEQQPLLLSVAEAGRLLGQCRSSIYELLAQGRLGSVKVGRSRRIPRSAVEGFVTELVEEQSR